ncbi:hypothetical protein GCM10027074_54310 [Streptomyces deserti]
MDLRMQRLADRHVLGAGQLPPAQPAPVCGRLGVDTAARSAWVITQPLGRGPVVPEVYAMVATDCGRTA